MCRYYSAQRPILPGGFPKKSSVENIENFDTKIFCEEIGQAAWGYIEYREPLTKEESEAYELIQAGMKPYWCVTTSVNDKGKVVAKITSMVEAVCKPKNTFTNTRRMDIYNDWFESLEKAENFVEEARMA